MTGGPYSRASPFPWDLQLDPGDGTFVGLMLEPGQDGLMVGHKEQSLAGVSPDGYGYGSQDPARETTFSFTRLTGGMGEKIQTSASSNRYRYAMGVDCSIGGMPRLGPLFTDETFPALPASTYPGQNDVRQFVVAFETVSLVPTLFALVRDHVYRRTAGVWVLSKDFSAIGAPTQAVVFTGTAGTVGLWVATSVGELWKYDGVAWTKATLPAATFAVRVEAVRGELWIGQANHVWVCVLGDPLLAASWGGAVEIGDDSAHITNLRALANDMYVHKANGVYTTTTTATGVDANDLFPELRALSRLSNGQNAAVWRDALWFGYGDGFYRLSAGAELEPIGPERLLENDSPVRGMPIASAGWNDWALFLVVYNTTQNASYLMKYGAWHSVQESANYQFTDVWNGAIASWTGKRVTRVDVIQFDTERDPTYPGPALWVGFQDGTTAWTPLPARSPDPTTDTACRYTPSGLLYWPLHHAMYESTIKSFHGFSAIGPVLNASQTVYHAYRTDLTAGYTNLTPNFTANGQRVELPDATTGVVLDCATELRTASSALTPILEGMALHEAIRPSFRIEDTATVRAKNRLVRHDGMVSRRSSSSIRAVCLSAAANPGHVRIRTPAGGLGSFATIDYRESLAPAERRWGLEWAITLTFLQFK